MLTQNNSISKNQNINLNPNQNLTQNTNEDVKMNIQENSSTTSSQESLRKSFTLISNKYLLIKEDEQNQMEIENLNKNFNLFQNQNLNQNQNQNQNLNQNHNKNNEIIKTPNNPTNFSPLPKPDFSEIEKIESNFQYKERGSYKKAKQVVPESPMKSPCQKFFTPVKLQSNLFGFNSTFRKLNFNQVEENINEEEYYNCRNEQISKEKNLNLSDNSNEIDNDNDNDSINNENNNNEGEESAYCGLKVNKLQLDSPKNNKNNNNNNKIRKNKNKSNNDFKLKMNVSSKINNSNDRFNNYRKSSVNDSNLNKIDNEARKKGINKFLNNSNKTEQVNFLDFMKGKKCENIDNKVNLVNQPDFNKLNFNKKDLNIFANDIKENNNNNIKNNNIINKPPMFSINNFNNNKDFNNFFSNNNNNSNNAFSKIFFDNDFKNPTINNKIILSDLLKEDSDDIQMEKNDQIANSKFETDYKILGTLESGEFGIVYKCLSYIDENIYAIKKTKKPIGKNEIVSTKNLIIDLNQITNIDPSSKFIVKYNECWVEEGLLLIKQEFCEFGDLFDFMETLEEHKFKFNADFFWDLIFQMLCGLKYIHNCGYIHLDIKPQNFFITNNGILKLGDFNLSRKRSIFDHDYFEGDSTYMAPEILEATKIKNLDERCDIFSLGLSIIEILFRIELPQNGPLWRELRGEGFIFPNEFYLHSNITNIPQDFYRLIYGMINFDPKKRFGISYMFENFPEFKNRFDKLSKNQYKNSYEDFLKNLDSSMIMTSKKSRDKKRLDFN